MRDNNRLIADFIEYDAYTIVGIKRKYTKSQISVLYKDEHSVSPSEYWLASQRYIPEYNSSWDLLMPVVAKIAENTFFSLTLDDRSGSEHKKLDIGLLGATVGNLELVYSAVVEFIKWFKKER